jgi:hypothetical protein
MRKEIVHRTSIICLLSFSSYLHYEMSGKSSPRSDSKSLQGSQSSRGRECQVKVWSSDNQGRLIHVCPSPSTVLSWIKD